MKALTSTNAAECKDRLQKQPFRPAKDDTKLVHQDLIRRSDPFEIKEVVLQPPPFHFFLPKSKNPSKFGRLQVLICLSVRTDEIQLREAFG